MDKRKNPHTAQKQKWEEMPYGDYLNAVDDLMESSHGRASTQEELAYIAECQEALCSPEECAKSVVSDDRVSVK
jgi:hypothetical protein